MPSLLSAAFEYLTTFLRESERRETTRRRKGRYRDKVWTAVEQLEDRSLLSGTVISTNFDSGVPSNAQLVGSAFYRSSNTDVVLTQEGVQSQLGSLIVNSPGEKAMLFTANARVYIGGDASGGDGMSLGYGNLTGGAFGETGTNSGLWLSIDTYQGDHTNGEIAVYHNGTKIASHLFTGTSRSLLAPDGRRDISLSVGYANSTYYVSYYHPTIGTQSVNLTGWNPQANWRFGMGARTGGATDLQNIDELHISFTTVNEAPAGANATLTAYEDTPFVLSASNFGFSDVNNSAANSLMAVRISSLPSAGSLTLNGSGVSVGQEISVGDINSGLLRYTPGANAYGSSYASFNFQVRDNGGTANGGFDLDPTPNTITFNVLSVNDAPSGTNAAFTILEDSNYVFSAGSFGFSDPNDSPANSLESVRISTLPTQGQLTRNGSAVTVGQEISVADLNGGLLRYAPAIDGNGTNYASFTFQVRDNGGTSNGGVNLDPTPNTIVFHVTPVNDPPVGADAVLSALEDTPYVFNVNDFGLTDPKDNPPNELLELLVDTLPVRGSLTLNGAAVTEGQTISAAAIAAGELQYQAPLHENGSLFASFMFRVRDNGGTLYSGSDIDPTPRTITIHVTPVNDAPQGMDASFTILEDTPHVFQASDFGFTDIDDDPAHSLLAVTISSLPAAGLLTLNGNAVTAGQSISVADIHDGLFEYTPAANAHGTSYASFTFQVQDDGGTANRGVDLDPTPRTMTFDVTSVNDAPLGADATATTPEDTPYVFTVDDFGFSDEDDSPANAFVAVTINTIPMAGTIALNGVAVTEGQLIDVADIVARRLQFLPDLNQHGVGYASFTFLVHDDGGIEEGGVAVSQSANTITIHVTSVNDAPSGADNTVTTLEDEPYVFSIDDFGFTDLADDPANSPLAVLIATLPENGLLTLDGADVAVWQSVSAADIRDGLLRYLPPLNANGAGYASFTFLVQDDGGTLDGGADLDATPRTMTIDVTSVNDAPSGAEATVSTFEDSPYVFAGADFGFSDAADAPANSLMAVTITTLPAAGSLTLNGAAVVPGQSVSLADIAAGRLHYLPALHASGESYDSFTFQVQDDGGTLDGGNDLDPDPRTITIDVIPVADAPQLTVDAVSGDEDTAITIDLSAAVSLTDDDGSESITSLVISCVPVGAVITDGTPENVFQATEGNTSIEVLEWDLAHLTITPLLHSGDDFTLKVTATSTEAVTGESASTERLLAVTVVARADQPTLEVENSTTNEDVEVALTVFSLFPDTDGSETHSIVVSGIPVGAKLSDGSGNEFTAANGSQSVDIVGWNLAGLRILPPLHSGDDFRLTFTSTAVEGENDDTSAVVRQLDVTVIAVVDVPTLEVNDAETNEDTTVALTIVSLFPDQDGSESHSLVVSGIPVGATLSDGSGHSFTAAEGSQSVDILGWNLAGLRITPPANSGDDFTLKFTSTAIESENDDTAVVVRWLNVTVHAVADAPSLATQAVIVREDQVIPLTVTTALNDLDGSESLSLYVAGIPAGYRLIAGSNSFDATAGNHSVDITSWLADLGSLRLIAPENSNDVFTLTFTARSDEAENESFATTVRTLLVTVLPVNDPPVVRNAVADPIDQAQIRVYDLRTLVSDIETTNPNDFTFGIVAGQTIGGLARMADDGYHAIFIPFADFVGTARYYFTATDTGEELSDDPNDLLRQPLTETRWVSIEVIRYQDMGDAPDSYGTTAASDGARHGGTHHPEDGTHRIVRLGRVVGYGELDAQPGASAEGDDVNGVDAQGNPITPSNFLMHVGEVNGIQIDDDDGVFLIMGLGTRTDLDKNGNPIATASKIAVVAPSGGKLDAWIDFNGNGVFDASEHLFGGISQDVTPKDRVEGQSEALRYVHYFDIVVPPNAFVGTTYARFRISTQGNLGPTGFATDGEVEDYKVVITDITPSSKGANISAGMNVATEQMVTAFADELIADPYFVPAAKGEEGYIPFVFTTKGGANGQQVKEGEEGFTKADTGETLQQIIDRINAELQKSRPKDENWLVFISHPVDFVITDSSGRSFGSVGGNIVQSARPIPNVTYSGDGAVEVLVIRNAGPGEYKMDFTGVGGIFRGGSSLLTNYSTQVATFQGALGLGGTVSLALDYAPPPVALTFGANGQIASNGQGLNQVFLNVEDRGAETGDLELNALADLAELGSPYDADESVRDEFDRMVQAAEAHVTAAKRLLLDGITPDWLADFSGVFGEFNESDESAELVEEFWKGVGESLLGGIPGRVFHLAEVLGVDVPHLFLPNESAPAEPAAEEVRAEAAPEEAISTASGEVAAPDGAAAEATDALSILRRASLLHPVLFASRTGSADEKGYGEGTSSVRKPVNPAVGNVRSNAP